MILYHGEPNQGSGRVLICLHEMEAPFRNRYVDALTFEHYAPEIVSLDGTGELPLLVISSDVYTGPSEICEYLEETLCDQPLMPAAPLLRWRVRHWQKHVDECLAPAINRLAWQANRHSALEKMHAHGTLAALERIPSEAQRAAWQEAINGYEGETIRHARQTVLNTIAMMESQLARSSWLAGDFYSLADIAVFPYINYCPQLLPMSFSAAAAPNTVSWLARMNERPAVRRALAMGKAADPYALGVPAPEQIRWG